MLSTHPPISEAIPTYSAILDRATPANYAEAAAWYPNAQRVALEMCVIDPTLDVERAASIISAFSPRVHWSRNVTLAKMFVSGLPVRCLGTSIRNAEASRSIGFDALRGLKTNAFARAIAGDGNAVVIDTHMIKPFGMDSVNRSQYQMAANAVRSLAPRFNMPPATLQALIWVVQRGRAE